MADCGNQDKARRLTDRRRAARLDLECTPGSRLPAMTASMTARAPG
jgi:hypothetical protein